jgi:hypothetical protein
MIQLYHSALLLPNVSTFELEICDCLTVEVAEYSIATQCDPTQEVNLECWESNQSNYKN